MSCFLHLRNLRTTSISPKFLLQSNLNQTMKQNLKDMSFDELSSFVEKMGEPLYRSRQISEWLYHKKIIRFDEMTNLPLQLRDKLKELADINGIACDTEQRSVDGTIKYLFRLKDGRYIETVLIPDKERITICISTQVGCKMGCRFCLTGKYGFKRNLYPSEIIDQILFIWRAQKFPDDQKINIVFMGMGEPLDNYNNVVKSIRIFTSQTGFNLSARRLTLSTCGLIPELKRLGEEELNINIAISINASTDKVRRYIMPVEEKYPFKKLLKMLKKYSLKRGCVITIEYVMINDLNDSEKDAERLADLLDELKCKINLISFNDIAIKDFVPSSMERIIRFQNVLKSKNYIAVIRKSKGADIMAACGQLGGEKG